MIWEFLLVECDKESFVRVFEKKGKFKVDLFSKKKSKIVMMTQEETTSYTMKNM